MLENSDYNDYLDLKSLLTSSGMFQEIILEQDVMVSCTDPIALNDPGIQPATGYYIENANIPCAWAITTGDPNIVVAVVDLYLDYNHSDLQGKITDIQFANPTYSNCGHGFASTGAVAAIPNNGICVAGSGNQTKVAFYACATNTNCMNGLPGPGILKAIPRWKSNHLSKFY